MYNSTLLYMYICEQPEPIKFKNFDMTTWTYSVVYFCISFLSRFFFVHFTTKPNDKNHVQGHFQIKLG